MELHSGIGNRDYILGYSFYDNWMHWTRSWSAIISVHVFNRMRTQPYFCLLHLTRPHVLRTHNYIPPVVQLNMDAEQLEMVDTSAVAFGPFSRMCMHIWSQFITPLTAPAELPLLWGHVTTQNLYFTFQFLKSFSKYIFLSHGGKLVHVGLF